MHIIHLVVCFPCHPSGQQSLPRQPESSGQPHQAPGTSTRESQHHRPHHQEASGDFPSHFHHLLPLQSLSFGLSAIPCSQLFCHLPCTLRVIPQSFPSILTHCTFFFYTLNCKLYVITLCQLHFFTDISEFLHLHHLFHCAPLPHCLWISPVSSCRPLSHFSVILMNLVFICVIWSYYLVLCDFLQQRRNYLTLMLCQQLTTTYSYSLALFIFFNVFNLLPCFWSLMKSTILISTFKD